MRNRNVRNAPSARIICTVASSISEMQSHSTLPCGVRNNNARWAMPKAGVVQYP